MVSRCPGSPFPPNPNPNPNPNHQSKPIKSYLILLTVFTPRIWRLFLWDLYNGPPSASLQGGNQKKDTKNTVDAGPNPGALICDPKYAAYTGPTCPSCRLSSDSVQMDVVHRQQHLAGMGDHVSHGITLVNHCENGGSLHLDWCTWGCFPNK